MSWQRQAHKAARQAWQSVLQGTSGRSSRHSAKSLASSLLNSHKNVSEAAIHRGHQHAATLHSFRSSSFAYTTFAASGLTSMRAPEQTVVNCNTQTLQSSSSPMSSQSSGIVAGEDDSQSCPASASTKQQTNEDSDEEVPGTRQFKGHKEWWYLQLQDTGQPCHTLTGHQVTNHLGLNAAKHALQLQSHRHMTTAAGSSEQSSKGPSSGRPRETERSAATKQSEAKGVRPGSTRPQQSRSRTDVRQSDDTRTPTTGDQQLRSRMNLRQPNDARDSRTSTTGDQQTRNRMDFRQFDRKRSEEYEKPTPLQELEDEVLDLRVFLKDAFMHKQLPVPPGVREVMYSHRWDKLVVDVRRSTKLVSGKGKVDTYTAMVAVGNMKGLFGLGIGDASTAQEAVAQAHLKAYSNLQVIPLYRSHTIFHPISHNFHRLKMDLNPQPAGKGIVASDLLTELCNLVGIKDIWIKVHARRRSRFFVAMALLEALQKQAVPHDGVEGSGVYLKEVYHRPGTPMKVAAAAA